MFQIGVFINLVLAFFNLLPIPPMDGSRLVSVALPYEAAQVYNSLERYGMIIILIFLATGMFAKIILPLVYTFYDMILLAFLGIIKLFVDF
jgi:Zn-dependent protease